jgi:hypothetical protein
VRDGDLPAYWAQMSDERAQQMAAVTRGYHYDRAAFDGHWDKVRSDPAVLGRTVLADGEVAGHVAAFGPPQEREVTYWVGRAYWGRGVATAAPPPCSAWSAPARCTRTRPRTTPRRSGYSRSAASRSPGTAASSRRRAATRSTTWR